MRLTDFCHLNDTAYTRTSCVPGWLHGFHRVLTPRSLGLRAAYQGTECFTGTRERFGGSQLDTYCLTSWIDAPFLGERGSSSVGVVFPRRHSDRASDTSVATPSSAGFRKRLRATFMSFGSYEPYRLPAWGSRQGCRDHDSVKSRGSWQPKVPSIVRDPS